MHLWQSHKKMTLDGCVSLFIHFLYDMKHAITVPMANPNRIMAILPHNIEAHMNILFTMKRRFSCSLSGHIRPHAIMSSTEPRMVIIFRARHPHPPILELLITYLFVGASS